MGTILFLFGTAFGATASLYFSNNNYQTGFHDAKTLVEKSMIGSAFATPDDVRVFRGMVTAVGENQITLHVQPINPFDDPALADRTILIDTDTSISKMTFKDKETLQSEMAVFQSKLSAGGDAVATSPQPFIFVDAVISDISAGMSVAVASTENVRDRKQFTATEVHLLPEATILAP
jgi:hypothetical protein